MEEDFYPFLLQRRSSYLGEEEVEQQEEDLNLALERKDKDLLLAAELGKALLERNDYLERGREALEEELRETREASQAEQSMTLQMQKLREENRELNLSQGQLAPCLQSLQSENALLLEQKRDLESRMKKLQEDQENSQNLLFTLKDTAMRMERQKSEAEARLQEGQVEAQRLRDNQRLLQIQVQELQDELKMRDSQALHDNRNSLHSEMEDCQDGIVISSTSQGAQTARVPDPSVHMAAYLTQRERDLLKEKEEEVIRLQDQVTIQYVEMNSLREELQKLRDLSQQNDRDSVLRQAIGDRDEAIMKKGELELELAKCRLEKDSMSRQLLSAVEQKVLLSQELEAWQDDMQIVISQQLKSQREQEKASDSTPSTPTRRGSSRRTRDSGSGIFSFFKRI
ncbi:BICD family-like cargo adapter 2 [Pyxicephalus adspersus]|uniref:BICD family-like cargo adapter 2 n=1 Tax=Pyxicephalus adspersus TaxID=30357 RepID=UPI003B5A1A8C